MAASEGCGPLVALVTGGNRGIGFEVVKDILEQPEGHFVFLGCRDLQSGNAAVEQLRAKFGDRVEALRLDQVDAACIAQAADQVRAKTGRLDILVNNGGILLEGDGAPFSMEAIRETMRVNFDGVVAVTEAFLPLLAASPSGAVLSTSSGTATRALGLLSQEHREALSDPALDLPGLRKVMASLVATLESPNAEYHSIPTVGYSLSKVGVNCFTQIVAREHPELRANACSPGFCNTGMCANYTGSRKPKDPALGASVFAKVLFGELGRGRTSCFFKEASKPGTPLDQAVSVPEAWVALAEK